MDAAYFEGFAGLYKDALPSTEEYLKLKKEEVNQRLKQFKALTQFEIELS